MEVTVSSLGRFHAFELARQLDKRGHLESFFTGYPFWKVENDLRPKTKTFPWLLVPQMAAARYSLKFSDYLNYPATVTFDHWVAANLPDSDVFAFMSQFGLKSVGTAKKRGIKTVCMRGSAHILEQDDILKEEFIRHKIPYNGIEKWAIHRELAEYDASDLIEVISTFARNTFVKHGIAQEKLYLNPLGVDLSMFHPVEKTDDVFRVLYVGAMSLQKGVAYVLQALSYLELPNFEIIFVGSMLDEIKPTFSLFDGTFKYLGLKSRADLYKYYSDASVFILPSLQDGFGAVLAQAMACRVPVIATTNSGGPDLITDGVEGFIIPIRDPEAIRDRVLQLYHDPDLRENMAQAALLRVQSIGGWDDYGGRSIQAYTELLNSP